MCDDLWRLEEYGSHGKYGLHTIVMIDMAYIQSRPSRPSLMQAESLLVLSSPSRPFLKESSPLLLGVLPSGTLHYSGGGVQHWYKSCRVDLVLFQNRPFQKWSAFSKMMNISMRNYQMMLILFAIIFFICIQFLSKNGFKWMFCGENNPPSAFLNWPSAFPQCMTYINVGHRYRCILDW